LANCEIQDSDIALTTGLTPSVISEYFQKPNHIKEGPERLLLKQCRDGFKERRTPV